MNIPYISALGEGDDECVSLANHLNCYLISRDSDYYCYNLVKGYVPFDYVDINPIETDCYCYLSAQLFTVDSLLGRFTGLNHSTLSLACCLCGNDYIQGGLVQPILDHITATVDKSKEKKIHKSTITKHWYVMQWIKWFDDVETALQEALECIKTVSQRNIVEAKLRAALKSYMNPTDTLIYRFVGSTNENLLKNSDFVQLAREYLDTVITNDSR
jgi:hypothetical protein